MTNQDVSPETPVEVDYSEFTRLENDDVDADEDTDEEDDSFAGSSILDDALAANEDDSHPREQNATLYDQMINDHPEVGRILTGEIPVVTNETETEADGLEDEPDVDVDESEVEESEAEETDETEAEESEAEESEESSVEDEIDDDEAANEPETHVEDESEADSPTSEFEFEDDESEDEESEDDESENDNVDDANVGLFDGVELDDSEELVTEDPKVLTMASFNRLMKS